MKSVMILRYWNGKGYKFTLRYLDKSADFSVWFNTMGQCREYAKEKGFNLVERPDLIAKWSNPSLNKIWYC